MFRKITIPLVSFITLFFLYVTIERLTMDYNENGVYFDGTNTYDQDAIVVYSAITMVLIIITVAITLVTRPRRQIH
jgi:hypothetical protein